MITAQKSNLDSTRRAAVKKGCVVSFGGTSTARVARVRLGWFYTQHNMRPFLCSSVTVVAP